MLQWWRTLAISRRAEIWTLFGSLCCGIFHRRFFLVRGRGLRGGWFFVVPWSRKGCYFVVTTVTSVFRLLGFFQHGVFHFSVKWFLLLYGFLIRWFFALLVERRGCWCSDKSLFSFLRRWDFFWDSFVILPDEGETRNVVTFNRLW